MISSDNHVHSYFSTDSEASMEEIILSARERKLDSVCFTDHMDYDFPKSCSWNAEKEEPAFVFDPVQYFQETEKLKKSFPDFGIRTGVELGLKKSVLEQTAALTGNYPFDFVIGSTHLVDDMDPYYPEYWEANGEERGVLRYYEVTLENINNGFDFDVYGHIDYILRYCPGVKAAINEHRSLEDLYRKTMKCHAELLREILSLLIQKGKGIEINTAGFKYGLGHPNPHETIISVYKELGGEIISVGSDAHMPGHIGYDFQKIPQILQSAGFSYFTEFHHRRPRQIPVGEI